MKDEYSLINEVMRIVSGAINLDIDKVRNYTEFLADKVEASGDKAAALRIRKMLENSSQTLKPADVNYRPHPPVDTETRFPLLEPVSLKEEKELVLEENNWSILKEFLSIAKSNSLYDMDGYNNSLSLVLYGPPGTGKSRIARHIASELGMTLYIARLDALVSSYLGSTSKNIRAVFEFVNKTPCILFLDEFDALAKLRGDTQELGELKRVVNSFIQNLDSLDQNTIVIAATNHEELLDAAIWRRFSYRLNVKLPEFEQRKQLWSQHLEQLKLDPKDEVILADISEGFSGSDIHQTCVRIQRRSRSLNTEVGLHDVVSTLANLSLVGSGESVNSIPQKIQCLTPLDTISFLRERDEKLYTYPVLARLLNLSRQTIHRLKRQGVAR